MGIELHLLLVDVLLVELVHKRGVVGVVLNHLVAVLGVRGLLVTAFHRAGGVRRHR